MAFSGSNVRRRHFLGVLAALGARAFLTPVHLTAQTAGGAARRIDVHSHFATPNWAARVAATPKGLNQVWRGWTPAKSIEYMDRAGVVTSLVSITMPGVWFGDHTEARRLARECNEYGTKMASDYRGRFGVFASCCYSVVPGVGEQAIEYGTDCPYSNIQDDVKGLQESGIFTADDLRAIGRENAVRLFPTYRT